MGKKIFHIILSLAISYLAANFLNLNQLLIIGLALFSGPLGAWKSKTDQITKPIAEKQSKIDAEFKKMGIYTKSPWLKGVDRETRRMVYIGGVISIIYALLIVFFMFKLGFWKGLLLLIADTLTGITFGEIFKEAGYQNLFTVTLFGAIIISTLITYSYIY